MRLLLDENVPNPLTATLKTLLRTSHNVTHILDLDGWSGTKDLSLYDQAAAAAFEVLLTNDAKQMQRRQEVEAIARSGVHRVQYPHRHGGLTGMGVAIATTNRYTVRDRSRTHPNSGPRPAGGSSAAEAIRAIAVVAA